MEGDDTVRKCHACQLNVYNFAGMSPEEICDVINRHGDKLCAQFYARSDGTMTIESCAEQDHVMLRGRIAIRHLDREVDSQIS